MLLEADRHLRPWQRVSTCVIPYHTFISFALSVQKMQYIFL
jgi:hypothetical protein